MAWRSDDDGPTGGAVAWVLVACFVAIAMAAVVVARGW